MARPEFQELPGKRPVVFWGKEGVGQDVSRAREYVARGCAQVAVAVFVDEGRTFRTRPPHPDSTWRDWASAGPGGSDVSILWARFLASA